MDGPAQRHRWRIREQVPLDDVFLAAGEARGLSHRLLSVLAGRGHADPFALAALLDSPEAGLHDPALLPDAQPFAERIQLARARSEGVLVFGDFDADGLTGLAIMARTLQRLGLSVEPYVPDRSEEGHGLSLAAVERAASTTLSLIVTIDCGSSSGAEIEVARARGIDVLVADHHRLPGEWPRPAALVNPNRGDSRYPDPRLAGSGVSFKLAQLLLGHDALEFADLAAIGTIADVAPIAGENRSIVRLGLERLRNAPRPGLAALLARAGISADQLDLDSVAYALAPRLNAGGRVGDAARAARLLLADDPAEADQLAGELEAANVLRRELLAAALSEARAAAAGEPDVPVTIVAGPWPVGIIGLIAGRLADERGRPAVVFSNSVEPWRGSARSAAGFDIGQAFDTLGGLFERFGGHAAAAGCQLRSTRFDDFRRELSLLAAGLKPDVPELLIDLVVPALEADYALQRELALLEPAGMGNPEPLVGIIGLTVARARAANGGHTQLVLRKGREVLDAICFGRDDLAALLREGEQLDVVARLSSRTFGGYESLQLEIRDVAAAGTFNRLVSDASSTAALAMHIPAVAMAS
jgi:single-stranded-DNA-specific exonuclease